jgi:hypothetical protein
MQELERTQGNHFCTHGSQLWDSSWLAGFGDEMNLVPSACPWEYTHELT